MAKGDIVRRRRSPPPRRPEARLDITEETLGDKARLLLGDVLDGAREWGGFIGFVLLILVLGLIERVFHLLGVAF